MPSKSSAASDVIDESRQQTRARLFEAMRQIGAAFDDVPDEELERELQKALSEVRAEMSAERRGERR
jgi:hypothetical protein